MQRTLHRRASVVLVGFVVLVVSTSCFRPVETQPEPRPRASMETVSETATERVSVSASDVQGLSAREALALANRWKTTDPDVISFVDTKAVSFSFADGSTAKVALPSDEMVVAVAPYLYDTHPCAVHSVSGCQGELVAAPLSVRGVTRDGTLVVDGTVRTMDNGFFELWLPRDLEVELTVELNGQSATQIVTTYSDSDTCITTMQLM